MIIFVILINTFIFNHAFCDQIARDFHFDFCFHLGMEINTFSMKTLIKDH